MSPGLSMFIPLASGLGYAVAALMLKRGSEGAGPWRVTFIVNWVIAIFFSFGWFIPTEHPVTLGHVGHAAISGALFFVGQIFTFLALSRGDVSVATPVLGSKVVFVALFTVIFGLETLNGTIWIAVLLTAVATALLGGGGGHTQREALLRSLLYGFSAAATFALTDVTQQSWIREWGLLPYMATLFFTMGLLSFGLLPLCRNDGHRMNATNRRWLIGGGVVISVQASGVGWGLVHLGATTTNVLYNSRGAWSVVLVWVVGHWFGNTERTQGRGVMLRRLAGSLVLLSAIFMLTRR